MKAFDKENFVLTGLDRRQKRQSLTVGIGVAVLYVLSAFTFMNFLYALAECIGSVVSGSPDVALRDALRSMPLFLSFFITIGGLMIAHAVYRNESKEGMLGSVKIHSVIVVALGVADVVYTIVMRIAGGYLSMAEGSPSPIYPLDSFLYAILFIGLGVCAMIYAFLYSEKLPYVGPSRAPVVKKARFIYNVGVTLWLLISLYGFCGFFYSFFIVDFIHGYLPYTLASMLVSLVAFLSVAVWEFYYNELKADKKKKLLLPLSIAALCVSVITAVIYFVALKFNLDGPSNVGFGLLPVAFAASVNIATIIVVVTPIVVSLTAVIKGSLIKKQ